MIEDKIHIIRELVSQDKLDDATLKLKELMSGLSKLDSAILISGRFEEIEKNIINGTINPSEASIQKNKIREAILKILSKIEKRYVDVNSQNDLAFLDFDIFGYTVGDIFKVLLSLWVCGFLIGILVGVSNKPDYDSPDTLKEIICSTGGVPYFEKGPYNYGIQDNILTQDDLYANDSSIGEFMCNCIDSSYLFKESEIHENPSVFALSLTTIECEMIEFYFDLETAQIKSRETSNERTTEYKIRKKGLKDFDWLNLLAAFGAYDRGKYVSRTLPRIVRNTKGNTIFYVVLTIGTAGSFYIGYNLGYDRGNLCKEIGLDKIKDSKTWLSTFYLEVVELSNGRKCYQRK